MMIEQACSASSPKGSACVMKPGYDRRRLTPGIVHFGVGNFHRAHQAVYLDRLFERGIDHDWAIVGAGLRPQDAVMRSRLSGQDWQTTVVDLHPDGLTARICGAMVDFAPLRAGALVARLRRPDIRIVSLTITEGGYFRDARSGGFQVDHPEIVHDSRHPDDPSTVFGVIVAALASRRAVGLAPFTVLSCDNLPGNGDAARAAVIGLAEVISPELARWIEKHGAFPNSMVDCITPGTTDLERALVRERFGIEDASPVTCEPFREWVLEDRFCAGRPALEQVGVQFVEDVAPYELMKLRILNGGHAALAYPAALTGFDLVHEAMADPLLGAYLDKLENEEIIPTVPPVAGVDFSAYFAQVRERFANEAVADTIPRLCLDGSNRQPKFILPIVAERLKAGLPIAGLALEVALWCRYCRGSDEAGEPIHVNDERADLLHAAAHRAVRQPVEFLDLGCVFGDLGMENAFRREFALALTRLDADGVRQTLADYVES